MANLTTVGITSGVPSSGTGTVSTIDNLLAIGVPITNGSSSVQVAITGTTSAPTSSMSALVVAISPNSVNPNGSALSSNSAPVVVASNQAAIPVTLSSTGSGTNTVLLGATTSGGLTLSSLIMSTTTNSNLVSSNPRQVYKIECFNNTASPGFLHTYNLASAPTAGSSLVFDRFMVPANGGFATTTEIGVPYTTGLSYTFTGGLADSDTTVIATANAYIVNIYYK